MPRNEVGMRCGFFFREIFGNGLLKLRQRFASKFLRLLYQVCIVIDLRMKLDTKV